MLVLTREVHEAVLIGESITVTVVSINSEGATLHVRYRDAHQKIEQKLALEVDDRLEITEEIYVSVLDIRGRSIRLGIKAPPSMVVKRKEVLEAARRSTSAGPAVATETQTVAETQTLRIGEDLQLTVARTGASDWKVHSKGQLVGGARDGETFERDDAISVGTVLEFGTLVRVCVFQTIAGGLVLKIQNPAHMICRIES